MTCRKLCLHCFLKLLRWQNASPQAVLDGLQCNTIAQVACCKPSWTACWATQLPKWLAASRPGRLAGQHNCPSGLLHTVLDGLLRNDCRHGLSQAVLGCLLCRTGPNGLPQAVLDGLLGNTIGHTCPGQPAPKQLSSWLAASRPGRLAGQN